MVGVSYEDAQQSVTRHLVSRFRLNTEKIHGVYAGTGGLETRETVSAYLDGAARISPLQRDLVSYAVNQLLPASQLIAGAVRAPYSGSYPSVACGYGPGADEDRVVIQGRADHPLTHAAMLRHEESERLSSLRSSGLLEAPLTESIARLPRIARDHFGTMAAAVTLVDREVLVSKSIIGLPNRDRPRRGSFCEETVQDNRTFIVADAQSDPRFSDSPHVVGPPYFRFYAGHPILGPGGSRIGALCIVDDRPRSLSHAEEHKLRMLAALVQLEILT